MKTSLRFFSLLAALAGIVPAALAVPSSNAPPESFSLTTALPPSNTVYITPAQFHVLYNNGIVIKDVRHRFFTQSLPPPPLGSSNVEVFSSKLDFQLSQNGGATFQSVTGAVAGVQVTVTHSSDTTSNSIYSTKMTMLNVSGGGSLPANIRLRASTNSPTTGQTTIRPVPGGFMISSFFDIFTDVSLDGGTTWTPPTGSGHVEMRTDPTQVSPPTPEPTPILPAPNDGYVSPAQYHALYANGIVIKNVRHRLFTGYQPPPPNGITNSVTETLNSQVDADVSLNGGSTFTSVRASAPLTVQVANTTSSSSSNSSLYDTKMLSLNATLLVGGISVKLRSSPTQPSRGGTEIDTQPGGTFHISSFFDIFTELSLDGGATWSPQTNPPVHMQLTPIAPEQTNSNPNLPPAGGQYVSPAQWHALYANGVILTNVSHQRFVGNFPTPTNNATTTETFGSEVDLRVSTDGGQTFSNVFANANVTVTVSNHTGYGSTTFYDTQMTQLDLNGGTLPPGMSLRVSPTVPSVGRTSVRTNAPGDFRISSFFDIFTELSLDGGQTWSPTTTQPGTMTHLPLTTNTPTPIDLACPSNITVTASGSNGATVFYSATVGGGCSPPVVTFNPPSGTFFPVGTMPVSCTATDSCGDTANCSFQVTVYPPVIVVCPSNITVTASNGSSSAVVDFSVSFGGGCGSLNTNISSPSGSSFPIGVTTVFVSASDNCGGFANCSFTITVNSATPVFLTCPSNITVTATSTNGAVVNFNPIASGGCSPPTVSPIPASGTTFPIGITTVFVSASDTCGSSTNCEFTVTVNSPAKTPAGRSYFSRTNSLPPTNHQYISPAQYHVLFNNGIVIKDVRHRAFTQNYPPPPLGSTTNEFFGSEVDFNLSTDNGVTFHPVVASANVTVQVTHSQDFGGQGIYDTEMTQLDLTGGGIMLRESPSLQSTGQTTIQPVPGGFMINSFFDIFTEVSLDNGATWTPAQGPGHVEMRPDPTTLTPPVGEPTPLLPAPNDMYVSPALYHALYANGIVIKDVRHKLFDTSYLPPDSGITNSEFFNSIVDLQVSTDGGQTFSFMRATNVPVQVDVSNSGSNSNGQYDAEMTQLDISLSNGVSVRVSPTLPSHGETQIQPQSDGSFHINSFFDIFTEVSLDGGATWSPQTNPPVHMQLTPQAPEVATTTPNLPLTNSPYISPAQWHALYANGIVITNVSHRQFTQTLPPPAPGASQTENFGSVVTGQISMNGGATFTPFSASAGVSVQVTSRDDLDTGSTRFFDTEMTSLNISSGLPNGIRLRASPTMPSQGRTSVRTNAPSDFRISSFFDVFTEVSLDGGSTWSPSLVPPGTMSPTNSGGATNCIVTINCPSNIVVTSSVPVTVFFTVTGNDSCGGAVNVISTPQSGSMFPIGMTTVNSTASDTNGMTNCSFTVTVVKPVCVLSIFCPSNITVTSVGPAVVFFNVTANDSCGGVVNVISSPPSGSTFPIGTTTVNSTAGDTNGTTNCSFTVTVKSRQRVFPSGNKVPPTNSVYISPAQWHAQYANGIYISNVVHRAFTANYPPPGNGQTTNETFGSKVDFKYSSDNGQHWSQFTANANCTVKVTSMGSSGSNQVYQTQMLQLDLTGGTMLPSMRLRVSPNSNTPSMGQTVITPSGNNFMISSFFDIFTDLSLDGGSTWMPSSSAGDMELHIDPANPVTKLVQATYQGGSAKFRIPTQVGLRYTVQYSPTLINPNWLGLQVISGNGATVLVTDPNGSQADKRFYRVLIDEDPNQ